MKKQINTMSTSFLDLLSGALGAVILLFVIVPKTSISELELVEQIRSLEIETSQLDSLLISIKGQDSVILLSEYNRIVEEVQVQMKKNKNLVESLSKQVDQAQKEIKVLQRKEHSLKVENRELQKEVQKLTPKQSTNQPKPMAAKSSVQSSNSTTTAQQSSVSRTVKDTDKQFYFGFEAELSIVVNWDTSAYDVDLYLENEGSFVDGFNRTKPFGKWVRIPKKYLSRPTEVIIQNELVPGTYKIHAHLSRPRRDAEVDITGFVAMDLGGDKTQKIDFGKKQIKSTAPPYHKRADGSTLIGTLEVLENQIIFNP